MVLQSLLVPFNRAELTRLNYFKFLKSSTTPGRKKSPAPGNGLTNSCPWLFDWVAIEFPGNPVSGTILSLSAALA